MRINSDPAYCPGNALSGLLLRHAFFVTCRLRLLRETGLYPGESGSEKFHYLRTLALTGRYGAGSHHSNYVDSSRLLLNSGGISMR